MLSNDVPMTRARVFVLIDAFERDIRRILTRFVLEELAEEDALGPSYSGARERQSQEVNPSETLIDYVYLREGYDLLNSHRKLLPEELAQEVRDLTGSLDRLVDIRKRVMHARPLLAGDSDAAVSLLNMYQTRYWSELKRMVAQLQEDPSWEPIVAIKSDAGFALHNLPLPDYDETGLIGRAQERNELVTLIKRKREPVLTITGEGGIGKTALALDVAYQIVDDSDQLFDAVLWTSLKYERMTAVGVRTITGAVRDIIGAAQPIGQAFDADFAGSVNDLAMALEGLNVLIVVDNLETVGGTEFSALYEKLPDTVSYLITSRIGVGEFERRYPLKPLSREDSLKLFNDFVRSRNISELNRISSETRVQVVTNLRFSPLAIKWFALAVEAGNEPLKLIHNQDQLLEFCVRSVYDSIEPAAREVLSALAIIGRPISVDELILLLDRPLDHINVAIQELLRGSLIRRENTSPSDLALRINLTETARAFLGRRVEADPTLERTLTQRESEYRQTEERRAIDMASRSLAPVVVWSRSQADAPTAQILRRALTRSGARDYAGAVEQIEIARRMNPDFWEVDRVEGFIRSQMGDIGEATAAYKRAYENSAGADRGVVAHFFAGHLARKASDTKSALAYAREAHSTLGLPETAVALGNYLVWSREFAEGITLIEPATASEHRGKARLIAITALTAAYRRWAEYTQEQDRNPLLAHVRARKGAEIALAAMQSGVLDVRLRAAGTECAILAVRTATYCVRTSVTIPDLAAWLKDLTNSLVRFVNSNQWNLLASESQRLATAEGAPLAARRLAAAVEEISQQNGDDESAKRSGTGEELVGEIVSIGENYGFLRHPRYPNNVYFRSADVIGSGGFDALVTGALARFSIAVNDRGPRAIDVRLAT